LVQELGWAPLLSKRAQADLAPRPSKTTEQKKTLRSPGIEPGSITWQATIITTRPRTLIVTPTPPSAHNLGYEAPLTQSVECWSYEPKVAGSSPAWSTDFCKASTGCKYKKKIMAVPGFEPGSSGSQPLMLTTTLYHRMMLVVQPWALHNCCWSTTKNSIQATGFEPVPLSRLAPKASALTTRPNLLT
jgi:hypothetical protein